MTDPALIINLMGCGLWQHRNGIQYRVLFLANVSHTTPAHVPYVVYECTTNGNKYVRPVSDWLRSFTPVA